jgi:Tol biopolymer transport system component
VAFISNADNLVPGDTNGVKDAFVKDRLTGSVERVSVTSTGGQASGATETVSMSADGRYAAFASRAPDLVPNDTNGLPDIFVRDRVNNTTVRVSTNAAGLEADGSSYEPRVVANGLVVFDSTASNLVPGDVNGRRDVFLKVIGAGYVELVSRGSAGTLGNATSGSAAITPDGRFVTFQSLASNLVLGDGNGTWDVFVRDRAGGTTERVSVSTTGVEGAAASYSPVISANGRIVAYSSDADNLVTGDTGWTDIFVRDRTLAATTRVSVNELGGPSDWDSFSPHISDSGRIVAFESAATNLVQPRSLGYHIFVRDLTTGHTELVSKRGDGTHADRASHFPVLSPDGTTVVFRSDALNLVPVTNSGQLYVRATGSGPDPNCDFGESSIVCELLYDDAVGPVDIRWYVDNVHVPALDQHPVAEHPCTPPWNVRITVVVSDANGPVDATVILPCLTEGPP